MTLGFSFDAVRAGTDSWGQPVYMRRDVAPLLWGLVQDYKNHGWGPLVILEGGRDRATQERYWNRFINREPGWTTAARPGTSKHEFGLAVDFGAPWDSYTDKGWEQLASIAGRWGFTNTEGWNTKPRPEAWHWVCDPSTATAKLVGAELAGFDPQALENDVVTEQDIQKIAAASGHAAALAVITAIFKDKDGQDVRFDQLLNRLEYGVNSGNNVTVQTRDAITGVDKRVADVQKAVDAVPAKTLDQGVPDANGVKVRHVLGTHQTWVNELKALIRKPTS